MVPTQRRSAAPSVRREAAILRKLDHPGIVGFLDAGESNGRDFFSMEWLAGPQLGERLCDGPLRRARDPMAVRLSDAIHYMHCRRFLYGEFRPSNIVFSGRGVAKLVDLESVTRLDRRGLAARSGGDPRYVAPEQWLGKDQKFGPAAHIFGLGEILFHALTGELPFDGICSVERMPRTRTLFPFPPWQPSGLRSRRLSTQSAASACIRGWRIGTPTRASWQTTCGAVSGPRNPEPRQMASEKPPAGLPRTCSAPMKSAGPSSRMTTRQGVRLYKNLTVCVVSLGPVRYAARKDRRHHRLRGGGVEGPMAHEKPVHHRAEDQANDQIGVQLPSRLPAHTGLSLYGRPPSFPT